MTINMRLEVNVSVSLHKYIFNKSRNEFLKGECMGVLKMKRRGLRIQAVLLALIILVTIIFSAFTNEKSVKAAGVTLIIHYARPDNTYDGWNLWVWDNGKEGKQVDFTEKDEFGEIAVYSTANTTEVGFIVRLRNWEAKDPDSDRFVTVKEGVTEIWLSSGVEDYKTTPPEGMSSFDYEKVIKERLNAYNKEEALKINVHYHSFSLNYNEMNTYSTYGDNEGGSYPLHAVDDFGAIFHIGILGNSKNNVATLQFFDESGNSDYQNIRNIDLRKAKNGVIDVYAVEGNPNLWYDISEVNYNPVIFDAAFLSAKEIVFKVSKEIDTSKEEEKLEYKVVDQEGKEYGIKNVWSENPGTVSEASLIMEEPLELGNTYTVERNGYGSQVVSVNNVFSNEEFENAFTYEGDDLGAIYQEEATKFRVWAPTATNIDLNLYSSGDGDTLLEVIPMTKDMKGTWIAKVARDLNKTYYTYSVTVNGIINEAVDPYARTTGVNGERGMIIDLSSTSPSGFENDKRPEFLSPTDAIIYELHVRDLSTDTSSGIKNVGKFLGLTETGTKNSYGHATGIDHLKELGITHLHLLPSFDYASVDESKPETNAFNWGYDPLNYNVPEGSYSTDPYHGEVRVNEFKQMVQSLHENGIRVVMDVVYNHTFSVDSNLNKIVPDYYYRKDGDSYSNGSGCGNETASERAMVRKYIVDSVVYWATEYHVDGFRFDLMGVHDMETMNAIKEALHEIDESIIIYGEGWTGGTSALSSDKSALKVSTYKMEGIAAFSDDIRDGIKGSVFDSLDKGFVSGKTGMEETIKFGVVGATNHTDIDYTKTSSKQYWAGEPGQCINYVSCHDNLTLWDKLSISNATDSYEDIVKMNKLASAIVFTSQGIPFIQAGEEFLRSKPSALNPGEFDENSYSSPDSTNSLKWDTLKENEDVYSYYQGLIAFRKAHDGLRLKTTEEINNQLSFIDGLDSNVVAYQIAHKLDNKTMEHMFVVYNANKESKNVTLPDGSWGIYINGEVAGNERLNEVSGVILVEPISAMVLVKHTNIEGEDSKLKDDSKNNTNDVLNNMEDNDKELGSDTTALAVILTVGGAALVAAATIFGVMKYRNKKHNN